MKKKNSEIIESIEFGGASLSLSTGKLASQASGAVMARHGDTVVFATVVSGPEKTELDYFPLSVEYQERLYAGGRIKGSRWVKREGKATDEEILSARLIDRSIRPLFPSSFRRDVQVIVTVMSVDMEHDPVILASVAVSAAIAVSTIPWSGPVATMRVGLSNGEFISNPTTTQLDTSEMDLIVSSTEDSVVMIEAGINEVSEKMVAEAISYAKKESGKLLQLINDFSAQVAPEKQPVKAVEPDKALVGSVKKLIGDKLEQLLSDMALHEGGDQSTAEFISGIAAQLPDQDPAAISAVFEELIHEKAREVILGGSRPDGRKHNQLRQLSAEVGILPRTHGTGLFQRGQTQVLSVATLGASSLGQLIETAEGEQEKRYIHHYSMPPYATGETGRVGGPNRREIGHGALAERAIMPVIPSESEFPYAIRIVSEVMSSNGSTSMASPSTITLSVDTPSATNSFAIIDVRHTTNAERLQSATNAERL
jgi:polyribonucleotide nucleotidyltransferase